MSTLDSLRTLGLTTDGMVDTEGGDYFVGSRGSSWPTDAESNRGGGEKPNQYAGIPDPLFDQTTRLAAKELGQTSRRDLETFVQRVGMNAEDATKFLDAYKTVRDKIAYFSYMGIGVFNEKSSANLLKNAMAIAWGPVLSATIVITDLLYRYGATNFELFGPKFEQINRSLLVVTVTANIVYCLMRLEKKEVANKLRELSDLMKTVDSWIARYVISDLTNHLGANKIDTAELTPVVEIRSAESDSDQ